MKLLYVSLARSIWLFDTRALNPDGLSLAALGLFDRFVEKYGFAKAPKNQLDLNEQKALFFEAGTFINPKQRPVVVSFAIYTDGIIAETQSSTDDSTDFLFAFSGSMKADHNLTLPAEIRKGFLSQVVVECQTPLAALNPKLDEFADSLGDALKPLDGQPRRFEVGGIGLWTEDIKKPIAPAAFRFERKWSVPFSSNHYFSEAQLETRTHLNLLDSLEQILRPR